MNKFTEWLKTLHVHKWETVEDTGIHEYQVCSKCGKRRILGINSFAHGYQPIDRGWLKTGNWTEMTPPKMEPQKVRYVFVEIPRKQGKSLLQEYLESQLAAGNISFGIDKGTESGDMTKKFELKWERKESGQ